LALAAVAVVAALAILLRLRKSNSSHTLVFDQRTPWRRDA